MKNYNIDVAHICNKAKKEILTKALALGYRCDFPDIVQGADYITLWDNLAEALASKDIADYNNCQLISIDDFMKLTPEQVQDDYEEPVMDNFYIDISKIGLKEKKRICRKVIGMTRKGGAFRVYAKDNYITMKNGSCDRWVNGTYLKGLKQITPDQLFGSDNSVTIECNVESALLENYTYVAGNASTVRKCAGIQSWAVTNINSSEPLTLEWLKNNDFKLDLTNYTDAMDLLNKLTSLTGHKMPLGFNHYVFFYINRVTGWDSRIDYYNEHPNTHINLQDIIDLIDVESLQVKNNNDEMIARDGEPAPQPPDEPLPVFPLLAYEEIQKYNKG